MKGYVFTYGVDGFGADIAPANEEGCYLSFDKAFKHLCELNKEVHERHKKQGYCYNSDFDDDIEDACRKVLKYDEPPFGYYSIEEVDIIE